VSLLKIHGAVLTLTRPFNLNMNTPAQPHSDINAERVEIN